MPIPKRVRMPAQTAALSAAFPVGMAPSGVTTHGGGAGGFRAGANGVGDPNGQKEKAGFLNQPPTASDYLRNTREQAASPFEIRLGRQFQP